jgi:lysophospholipase L1-like esterase
MTADSRQPRNWVFLGDSLTEGLGPTRVSYVSELATRLRVTKEHGRIVHYLRMRHVDPNGFNRFIRANLAGYVELDANVDDTASALWIWNLASEGRTIECDSQWLPWLRNIAPERVFIYRASLESIIRPAAVMDGGWPWWVPASWRGFVAMDPRCYFSGAWYRRWKQSGLDAIKQVARRRVLSHRPGRPLLEPGVILAHYRGLIEQIAGLGARVHVLGLIPPEAEQFPGSPSHFNALNTRLRALADEIGVDFFDWAQPVSVEAQGIQWRYRDGFHPNFAGSQLQARLLHEWLTTTTP